MAHNMTLSLPVSWVPALLLNDTHHMPPEDRTVFTRWHEDMTREFGEFTVCDVYRGATYDRCHEGTEYGAPLVLCQDVVLALPDDN